MPVILVSLLAMINQCSATGSVDEQKKSFRKKIRSLKQHYTIEDLQHFSTLLWNKIEEASFFREASVILLYWSLPDEVSTHDFIRKWSKTKTIILPSISGADLILKQYQGEENLIAGEGLGIPEPQGEVYPFSGNIDLIFAPGMAFDRNKNRLGRGKGYYDRLLEHYRCTKVGVCFHFQLFDKIPVDLYDQKMNFVVSD